MSRLKKLFGIARDYWTIITICVTIGTGILWAADAQKKMDAIEQMQLTNKQLEAKMFDFIINLWKIDPNVSNKWKVFPTSPLLFGNDTTVDVDWIEFRGFDALIKFKVTKDTLGKKLLLVDTLYIHRKDTV